MTYLYRYLNTDFKRAFALRFVIAIIFFVSLRFFTIYKEYLLIIKEPNSSIMYLLSVLFNDMLLGVLSAFTLISFGEAYTNEIKSGFISYFVLKGDKESYTISKLITLIISSLLVGLISYILIIGFTSFSIPISSPNVLFNKYPFILYTLETTKPWLLVIYLVIIRSMYLSMLGIASFTLNLYVRNKLLLFMGPSLIHAFSTRMGSFLNRTFGLPSVKLMSAGYIHASNPHIAFVLIVLTFSIIICICTLVAYRKMQEELKNE